MKVRNIKKEYGIIFRDESGFELVKWNELAKDITDAGFPPGAAVKKFKSGGDFSFETDNMKFKCKIHAVHSGAYSSNFLGCFVRYSNNPKAKITSIPLQEKFARSISTNIRVQESYQEIAEVIVCHFEEYLSEKITVQLLLFLKIKFRWISRKLSYHIVPMIVYASLSVILFVAGYLTNAGKLDQDVILKFVDFLLTVFT